jgi:predicted nucleic acid-binding protein
MYQDYKDLLSAYSQPDLMIAATAIHHGFTIVTRKKADADNAKAVFAALAKFGAPLAG